jgi:hypothetical protein
MFVCIQIEEKVHIWTNIYVVTIDNLQAIYDLACDPTWHLLTNVMIQN